MSSNPRAPEATPEAPIQLLFIHHSCGGQLLADPGQQVGGERDSGRYCIYDSHPNGGGLRRALQEAGFAINEVSYGSRVGEDTDIRHWLGKFRDEMDRILHSLRQDEQLPAGRTNRIVAFKSCYPNNAFVDAGREPGDPEGAELTVANAKAAYAALLPLFRRQADVLFVAFTAPPQAEPVATGLKARIRRLFKGRPKAADHARAFNTWLADRQAGWLADYELPNVAVFDYYDILTDGGRSNWSRYPTQGGRDSHPSREGNRKAAEAFRSFITEAWARHTAARPAADD